MDSTKSAIASQPSIQEQGARKVEPVIGRRQLIKRTVTMAAMSPFASWPLRAMAAEQTDGQQATTLADIPLSGSNKLTIERRGQVALIGINRPYIQNRIDPETFQALARAYYDYDHDTTKDFIEDRAAEAEGRKPVYHGN